jgi:hypothetical protein
MAPSQGLPTLRWARFQYLTNVQVLPVTLRRAQPVVEGQLAVRVKLRRPGVQTGYALQGKSLPVDDPYAERRQLRFVHMADIFFIDHLV